MLAGPDAPPAWWHPPWRRRAYLALSLTTLALFVLNLASIHTQPTATPAPATSCRASPCYYFHYPPLSAGQVLLVMAVVTPLLLAARYPLLGWRIGWLALLLAPLVPAQWRGGWPWGPAQVLVLLVLFCVAGVRYRRPVLWWMWALSLIPWWLWLVRDLPDLNGPISATILFTAGTIAVDSISSRWRTQRALAAQTERTELERARRAVLEERTRIARELHDVVAHHMSLIAVQAETAPYRLSDLPESARRRVRLAERGGPRGAGGDAAAARRAALRPARRAGAAASAIRPARARRCRPPRRGSRSSWPYPGRWATCLPALRCARTGLCRNRCPMPASTRPERRSACRWATMPGRSGCGWPTGPGGPAGPSPSEPGSGHGLTGMRERVALLGGSLSAGPSAGGGFVVSAVLPLGKTA